VEQADNRPSTQRNKTMIRSVLYSALSLLALGALPTAALAETRVIDLGTFTSAAFESSLSAKIAVGGEQSVTIEGNNPADLDDIRFEIVNGELRVWRDMDFWDYLAFRGDAVTVTITVPELDGIAARGASGVEAVGITGDALNVEVSSASIVVIRDVDVSTAAIQVTSAGKLMITGESQTARIETSSAGIIGARGFEVVDIDIEASSGSQMVVFASGLVTADASSGAIIEIAGNPLHVDDEESTGADVNVLD
jgi:hypothetical protein